MECSRIKEESDSMRIDAYHQVSQIYGAGKVKKTKPGMVNVSTTTDEVTFSSIGRDMQTAKTALKQVPDVREDKVAALKAQIQNGTYSVSGESFAEKLLSAYESRGF